MNPEMIEKLYELLEQIPVTVTNRAQLRNIRELLDNNDFQSAAMEIPILSYSDVGLGVAVGSAGGSAETASPETAGAFGSVVSPAAFGSAVAGSSGKATIASGSETASTDCASTNCWSVYDIPASSVSVHMVVVRAGI